MKSAIQPVPRLSLILANIIISSLLVDIEDTLTEYGSVTNQYVNSRPLSMIRNTIDHRFQNLLELANLAQEEHIRLLSKLPLKEGT